MPTHRDLPDRPHDDRGKKERVEYRRRIIVIVLVVLGALLAAAVIL